MLWWPTGLLTVKNWHTSKFIEMCILRVVKCRFTSSRSRMKAYKLLNKTRIYEKMNQTLGRAWSLWLMQDWTRLSQVQQLSVCLSSCQEELYSVFLEQNIENSPARAFCLSRSSCIRVVSLLQAFWWAASPWLLNFWRHVSQIEVRSGGMKVYKTQK